MPQQWNRTSPLHWFESFLSWAIIPFSRAKKTEVYATNGYYLMGVVLLIMIFSLWVFGFLSVILSQLPASLRDIPGSAFGPLGRKFLPESIPFIILLVLVYWILFIIKPIRIFVGEAFAKLFFGTINVGIIVGEWCLEHRWGSLFIVIILVGYITWGTFYFFGARNRNDQLKAKFDLWLKQADKFSAQTTQGEDDTNKYQNDVKPFWDDDFPDILSLPRNHPAFTLHAMLEDLYPKPMDDKPKSTWTESRTNHLDKLQKLAESYEPPEPWKMTPEEKRSWAWINILLGRMYFYECKQPNAASSCIKAYKLFNKVVELDQFTTDKSENYPVAAHNGRAAIYMTEYNNLNATDICPDKITCANNALNDYAVVGGTECSFLVMRRENNKIDLLRRIGFEFTEKKQGINLSAICDNKPVENEAALATCIETKVQKVMECTNKERNFIPIIYMTAAQAYAVIAKLRLKAPEADVRLEAKTAGYYLHLAYMFNTEGEINRSDFSNFRDFLFAKKNDIEIDKESECLSPKDEKPSKDKKFRSFYQKDAYRCVFWDATESFRNKVKENISDDLKTETQK